jgi:transmembrane sensor
MKQFDHNISEELLTRYLLNETSEQESMFIKEALASDASLRDEFQKLKNILDMVSLTKIDTELSWNKFSEKLKPHNKRIEIQPKQSSFSLRKLAVAASVLIIIGFAGYMGFNSYMSAMLITVADTDIENVSLKDGSEITLNRNSEIHYPRRFTKNTRTVQLNGEAFFQVASNPDKPFIVETTDLDVRVLGTSFYVKAWKDNLPEVTVETGKVECHYKPTGEKVILTAGQTAIFGKTETPEVRKTSTNDLNNFAWRTYRLKFENESFSNIVNMVNKAYGSNLIIEGDIKNCKLTVNFENLSLDGVVNVMQSILDVNYIKTKDKIILRGDGC